MTTLRILNWGHRRALAPIEALKPVLAEHLPGVEIEITERSLADFEHQGIEGVARSHDLIVFDHPFCGTIARSGAFVPLETELPDLLGAEADTLYIGPSLDTYRFEGHVWGAPIDGATQHAAYRRDLMEKAGEAVPQSLDEVFALGERLRGKGLYLGLAVETPHALMTIGSLMANAGKPWQAKAGSIEIDRTAFAEAYDDVARLLTLCPAEALGWNSIDLHDQMVAREDVLYCPSVYGYATYAEADIANPLSFADFAGRIAPFAAGSTIGGTAFGLSRHCEDKDAALRFLCLVLSAEIQRHLFTRHHGQPARIEGWTDKDADQRFGGFYSGVTLSMDTAWTRPRADGYPQFQAEAGRIVAGGFSGKRSREESIDRVLERASRL